MINKKTKTTQKSEYKKNKTQTKMLIKYTNYLQKNKNDTNYDNTQINSR